MRSCSAALAVWLDSTTSDERPRHLVTVTLRGGAVYRWTDHTADLVIAAGATFLAGGQGTTHPIVKVGRSSQLAGLDIASLSLTLECGDAAMLGTKRLPLAAAQRAFDGATVKVERIFLAATTIPALSDRAMHWFEGLVGEVTPSSTRVEIEVESGVAALAVEIPRRRFTPGCSNVLFDAQCGLDKATYTVTRTVSSYLASDLEIGTSTAPEATDHFTLGVLTMLTGAAAGESRGVRKHDRPSAGYAGFVLDRAFSGGAPAVGDTFTVYPGCDKRLTTCATKFGDNSARFTGFPAIPREGPLPSPSSVGSAARAASGLAPLPPAKESNTYGEPIPVLYGKTRIATKNVYAGPASNNPPIADTMGALCEGPITAVDRIFTGGMVGPAAAGVAGISHLQILTGTRPTQTPWSRLPSGKALGYPGTALVAQTIQLENGRPPEQTWEVRGFLAGTGGSDGDAHPVQVVRDMLGRDPTTGDVKSHDPYGAQFPFSIQMSVGLDGNAASSFARWVEQNAFWLSPALTTRRAARDWLEELLEAVNAEALWRSGVLWLIPRGDAAVGTFTPVNSVRYTLARADLVEGGDDGPVHMELAPEADSYNLAPVRFRERAPEGVASDATLAYQEATEQDPDPLDVSLRGERPAGTVELLGVTSRAHALKIARMRAQRLVRVRRTIEVSVGWRFCRLEPLDLVTATDDLLPLNLEPMQIREIEEDPETMALRITAEHWEGGVNLATAHQTQSSDGGTTQWGPYETEKRVHELAARSWTSRLATGAWNGVASDGARIVVVGESSGCRTSDDAITWTTRTIGITGDAVAWAESLGLYVAVGYVSACASSPDGASWTTRTIPAGNYRTIAWSPALGLFVAMGGVASGTTATCATSPDGATWTARTVPSITNGFYRAVVWVAELGLFVAVGDHSTCATSPDGATWTARTIPAGHYTGVAFGDGRLCAVGYSGACAVSSDAVTWASVTLPTAAVTAYPSAICWTGWIFLVLPQQPTGSSKALLSRDGQLWSVHSHTLPAYAYNRVAWVGRMAVAVGAGIATSAPV